VDQLIESGHIWRDSHPGDRRKVILRIAEPGLDPARSFFTPLGMHTREAMRDLPGRDSRFLTGSRRAAPEQVTQGPVQIGLAKPVPGLTELLGNDTLAGTGQFAGALLAEQ
jgi:hypothetical protein